MRFTHVIACLLCMSVFSTVFAAGANAGRLVNVNQATAKELISVGGLSKYKAHAIVAYRKKHGQFKSLDDLRKVKGFKRIKQDKMKSINRQLKV